MTNCKRRRGGEALLAIVVGLLLQIQPALGIERYYQCPQQARLDPILPKGKRFFHSVTGEYFPIKGIAYYPRPNVGDLSVTNSVDIFTEDFRDLWEQDIDYLEELGVNTIRIYGVDPSKSHDAFMCRLQQAGIYAIIGLLADCKDCGISPSQAPKCYDKSLKLRGEFIINEFSKYTNTLMYSAGNEATLFAPDREIQLNAPCQKKFLRDMRNYVHTCSAVTASILPRPIPVGMVNWDGERELQARYFNCRTDANDPFENTEWYGLNAYLHCDPTDTSIEELEGWIRLREDFAAWNFAVPIFLAEYGCREPFPTIGDFEAQRTWVQVDALYSADYVDVFAGGVVFEYSAEREIIEKFSTRGNPWPYFKFEKLQYGVGYYSPVDCDHNTTSCTYNPYPEFDLLANKFDAVDNSWLPGMDSYLPSGSLSSCPQGLAPLSDFDWPADEEPDLPCYVLPTPNPTLAPTLSPAPSQSPTQSPTSEVTESPSKRPTPSPSLLPTQQQQPTTIVITSEPSPRPTSVLGGIDAPAAFESFGSTPAPVVETSFRPVKDDTAITSIEEVESSSPHPTQQWCLSLMTAGLLFTIALQ